jgi:hypothetical protein
LETLSFPCQENNSPEKIFNAIRWMAEYLVRHHPQASDGVFQQKTEYEDRLKKSSDILKNRRLHREALSHEIDCREREARALRDQEATLSEEKRRREADDARIQATEAALSEQNKKGEKAVVSTIGFGKAQPILAFRNKCMSIVKDFDFQGVLSNPNSDSSQVSKIESFLFQEACQYLVCNSNASFAAAVSLVDHDTLHYHTTANRVENSTDHGSDGSQGMMLKSFLSCSYRGRFFY